MSSAGRSAQRNIRLQKNIETMLAKGRRNSAAALARIRSGSLPSWAGGPPSNPTPTIEEGREFTFPTDDPEAGGEAGNNVVEKASRKVKVEQMRLEDPHVIDRGDGNVDLGLVLSAMYCKLLVVMGIAFPLAEVISTFIPPKFYDGFYLYLYMMSILFMVCILGNVVRQKMQKSARNLVQRVNTIKTKLNNSTDSGVAPDVISNGRAGDSDESDTESKTLRKSASPSRRRKLEKSDSGNSALDDLSVISPQSRFHFGSFYLRMGAVAFGIGSMIYSGLEFGQYFELEKSDKCHNYWMALTPAVRMIFTFMQMYFIFFNSKMAIGKTSLGVQFGLMHMIGTNLSVWLNVLVEETRHEILHFYDPENQRIILHHGHEHGSSAHSHGHGHSRHHESQSNGSLLDSTASLILGNAGNETAEVVHNRVKRGLKAMYACRRSNVMGTLVDNASPFLFPCTIEYSLICAAICYVMWKSTAKRRVARLSRKGGELGQMSGMKRSHHHYTVDCSRANKGLFLGIFVLVMTIMSLIINFVMLSQPDYKEVAMLQVSITEIMVYTISTLAVLLGMCQVRELHYDRGKNLELDNILLIVAQTGSFIYNVFTIISGQFASVHENAIVLTSALLSLIQLLLQTLFIIDASKRTPATLQQAVRKPGREVVTFLMVTNLAMWLINTLENSRGDSHPVQLQFYGIWAWTIITDISMPLAIFYRFHSTVCLCEIWKKAYKMKTHNNYQGA